MNNKPVAAHDGAPDVVLITLRPGTLETAMAMLAPGARATKQLAALAALWNLDEALFIPTDAADTLLARMTPNVSQLDMQAATGGEAIELVVQDAAFAMPSEAIGGHDIVAENQGRMRVGRDAVLGMLRLACGIARGESPATAPKIRESIRQARDNATRAGLLGPMTDRLTLLALQVGESATETNREPVSMRLTIEAHEMAYERWRQMVLANPDIDMMYKAATDPERANELATMLGRDEQTVRALDQKATREALEHHADRLCELTADLMAG